MKLLLEIEDGLRTLADDGGKDPVVVGVIAGDDLALHYLPGGAEEARMKAVDLAAQPVDDLHVAVGASDADGGCWLAIIDREQLRGHLARFRAAGITPAHLLPAALLLPDGDPAMAMLGDRVLLRNRQLGACVEPGLAAALGGGDTGRLPAFRPDFPDSLPLDLLQGAFAPRFQWWKARSFQLAAALLLLLLLAAIAAPQLIAEQRARALVAEQDQETVALTASLLGQPPQSAEAAAAALAAARQAAEGQALGPRLALVTDAVANTPGARLERLALLPDGHLELVAGGPAEAIDQLGALLQAGPFLVERNGPAMLLGGRRPARAPASPTLAAMLRLATARQDAALLRNAAISGPLAAADAATRMAEQLAGSSVEQAGGNARLVVPAAKAGVLLPLLARLEQQGAGIASASIERNPDDTVNATLEFQ